LNYVAGQWSTLEAFREGRDIYCEVASDIYQRLITPDDKDERFFGKKTELSCGYGIGFITLFKRLRGERVKVTEKQCECAVGVYRSRHPMVLDMWKEAGLVLRWLASLRKETWLKGILTIDHGSIVLPNGAELKYALRLDNESGNFYRTDRRGTTKIWGSALTGEVVQSLASVFLREVLINIHKLTELKPLCLRHDEAVYCVPETEVLDTKQAIAKEFCRPPAWLPGFPLGCDIWDSRTYTKAKE
jgi:DNA polymerase bacteriophage-type